MNEQQINELKAVITKKHSNIGSIKVLKDKQIIFEDSYNNCTPQSGLHVYSVTKSIISLLIGIAIDHGFIQSVNQPIHDFFPTLEVHAKDGVHTTIRQLLTMSASWSYEDSLEIYQAYFSSDDFLNFSLSYLGKPSLNSEFRYTPIIGPDLLSGILKKATNMSVVDFANKYLFAPLDINSYSSIELSSEEDHTKFTSSINNNVWVQDKTRLNPSSWGLTLSVEDMSKIGGLYLNKGMYNQKQIVSTKWIQESTSLQTFSSSLNLGYGYLWWILDKDAQVFAAIGDGGNIIYINSKRNIVIAINAFYQGNSIDIISLITEYIEPMITQ